MTGQNIAATAKIPGLSEQTLYNWIGAGLLALGIRGGGQAGVRFIEAARLMSHLVNIGDTRTLVTHPVSYTHRQLEPEQLVAAGVTPDLVWISVGLETIDDILWDVDQSLEVAVSAA